MTLRVLHVIPSVAARDGGPSAAIGPMCAALRARGVEASILSTDADGPGSLDVPLGQPTTWRDTPAIFFRRDVSVAFKYSRGLARWIRAHVDSFDLVHIHAVLSHAPLAAAAACRTTAVPYVVRPVGTLTTWSLAQKPWRKRVLLAAGGRRMLKGAAALHYTSAEERDETERQLAPPRGVVIPLGIEMPDVDPTVIAGRDEDLYMVCVSRLHPVKRLELLIDAFAAQPPQTRGRWRLLIAGDGDPSYRRSLEARAASTGINSIRFLGWVTGAEKQALLAGASLFALPSQHENFGVSVLEAMAAEVPVVISREVGLSGAVAAADAGWVIDAGPQSLTAALAAAMTDASARAVRANAARRLAEHYSWATVAERIEAMYLDIHSQHAARSRQPAAASRLAQSLEQIEHR